MPLEDMRARLAGFRAVFGRFEEFAVDGRRALLVLVKNPTGANEALRTVASAIESAPILLALNDRIADGKDVSWIWDVDFEGVVDRASHVICSGRRADDMALRVRYADVPPDRIHVVPGVDDAFDELIRADASRRPSARPAHLHRDARTPGDGATPRPASPVLGKRVMRSLRVVPLYPELLSIYADRGNVRVLDRRATWRGIDVDIAPVLLGDDVPADADIYLIGGGQDRDQVLVTDELQRQLPALQSAVADGAAILAVCGGYQLIGHRYLGHLGDEMRGIGLIDLETVAGDDRLIGNIVCESTVDGSRRLLVGFENHAGRTHLDPAVSPLATVIAGAGNNGVDGTEGAVAGRIIGTYVHGPLLPKNPWLADLILGWALDRQDETLPPLADDGFEARAAATAAGIARAERRH